MHRIIKRDENGLLMQLCRKCNTFKHLIDFSIRYQGKDEPFNRHQDCTLCVNKYYQKSNETRRAILRWKGLSSRGNPVGMKQHQAWIGRNITTKLRCRNERIKF
jgi:hypothetical protein